MKKGLLRNFLKLFSPADPEPVFSSGDYWQKRYVSGRNSGAGSYGRLAEYKAEVINKIVKDREIEKVIEFGSGDGNQAALLDIPNYTGVDVSTEAVRLANEAAGQDPRKSFHVVNDSFEVVDKSYDLSMSLDVIYHLIEDNIFDAYMTDLFQASRRFVLIYASDEDKSTKNAHVRHRRYSVWIEENASDFSQIQSWQHPFPQTEGQDPNETSFASFKLFENSAS